MALGNPLKVRTASTGWPDEAAARTCWRIGSISTVRLSGAGTTLSGAGTIPKSWAGTGGPGSPRSPITTAIAVAVTCHRLVISRLLVASFRVIRRKHRLGGGASNRVNY